MYIGWGWHVVGVRDCDLPSDLSKLFPSHISQIGAFSNAQLEGATSCIPLHTSIIYGACLYVSLTPQLCETNVSYSISVFLIPDEVPYI
jgi:hypothetical protein